ncbi:hypothetical protein GQ457_03G023420 [Hibiscus cannabinus]
MIQVNSKMRIGYSKSLPIMVVIPNDQLIAIKAMVVLKNGSRRISPHITSKEVFVAFGNKPFLTSYNGSFINTTFHTLQNIQNALNDAGVGDTMKAIVPLNVDVYNLYQSNHVPSVGWFRADISGPMSQIVNFLTNNNSLFTVNIYPFFSLHGNDDFPFNYAFFDGGNLIVDNGIQYANVLDANFDTLFSSLKAVGHGDMSIIIGKVD